MSRTIPEITDERIAEIYPKKLRPIVRVHPYCYRHMEEVDPRKVAFMWDPKLTGFKLWFRHLEEVAVVETYHDWGYYGLFKPNIAEVLAQLTDEQVERADLFLLHGVEYGPKGEILFKPDAHNRDGYHKSRVTLYRKKSLIENIKEAVLP